MDNESPTYSRSEINTGLKGFFYWIVFMGWYWQTTQAASPIFIGFILAVGGDESAPSNIISLMYLTGLFQLFSHLITNRFHNKKWLVIIVGSLEGLFLVFIIVLSLALTGNTFLAFVPIIVMLSAVFNHSVNPLLNAWYGSLIPDSIRASYIGKRIMVSQVASIIGLTIAGKVVDIMSGTDGFYVVFTIGIIMVVVAYLSLAPVRFPANVSKKKLSFNDILDIPRNDQQFIIFCLFYGLWSIGYYNALPNLNVFMIRQLHLSFTQVAFYQNCQFFMMMTGYALWPRYINKFGAKSVMQFCLIPLIILPFVWFSVEQVSQVMLIPAMMMYGLCVSCVILGASTHLFAMIPKDERSPAYLVCWSVIVFSSMAIGPKIGSICLHLFKNIHITVGYLNIMNVKLTLLTVSAFFGLSFVMLAKLRVSGTVSATVLVDQIFRRNPLSLAYNMFVLEKSEREEPRAVALEKLGKSGGSMALETLVGSLNDISPVVRRQAASSIGETKLKEAASHLADIISDPESDLKIEASQALGMIDTQESLDALWSVIDDANPTVRASAVRSLGSFSGENIDDKLIDLLKKETNPITFLALVKTVGDRRNLKAVGILLQRYNMFKSSRIRIQMLNAIAMILGKGTEYYAVISSGKSKLDSNVEKYLESNYQRLEKVQNNELEKIRPYIAGMMNAYNEKDTQKFSDNALSLYYYINQCSFSNKKINTAAAAIHTFIASVEKNENTYLQGLVFLALCAQVIVDELAEM